MSKISDALRKVQGEPRRDPPSSAERQPAPEKERPGPEPAATPPPPRLERVVSGSRREDRIGLNDAFARELSALRASVEQSLADETQRTLAFAGAVPGEGASTVAARFCQLLGDDPRFRVALVDADFRNADPRPVTPVEEGAGMASVLAGAIAPERALRRTSHSGLDVFPSEGVAGDPYVLCTAGHVAPFLDFLRGGYHYAVLDCAPVLSAPETAILSELVDGVVLVVRAGRTKREIVQRALEKLRARGARVLGVVMNRQQYVIPEFIYRRL